MLLVSLLCLLISLCWASRIGGLSIERRLELFHHMNLAAASYQSYPIHNLTRQGITVENVKVRVDIFGYKPVDKELRLFINHGKKEVSVAIPGTDCVEDWVNNIIKCSGPASLLGQHQIQVHLGMFEESQQMYAVLQQKLVEYAELGYTLTFNGHSRAGPNCAFVMAIFGEEHPQFAGQCILYAFNSALGGGPQYVAAFNSKFPGQAFNVFDKTDIVGYSGLPGSAVPGEQLCITGDESITDHPHKITSLMSNYILSHLPDQTLIEGLPTDETFFQSLPDLREATVPASGEIETLLNDLNALRPEGEEMIIAVFPDMTMAGDQVATSSGGEHLVLILDIAQRDALIGGCTQFAENLTILSIDGDLSRKGAIKNAITDAIKAGAKTYVTSALTQYCTSKLDYSGMTNLEINRTDQAVGSAVNVAVGVVIRVVEGDKKGATQAAIWGSISTAVSYFADTQVSIGPAIDICTKGLFGKVSYIVMKSDLQVNVPIFNVPGLSAGVSISTVITMEYSSKSGGVVLVNEYKAECPLGGQVKFVGILQASLHIGSAEINGFGKKEYENGDVKYASYRRKVNFGVILQARAGHRGNLLTVGILKDVEWKQRDKFYKQPKNVLDKAPLRHLNGKGKFNEHGSGDHLRLVDHLAEQLGWNAEGRAQADVGDGSKGKKVRKGLHVYRSGKAHSYKYENFHESVNSGVTYHKNKDGSETTCFTREYLDGQDIIKTTQSGGRRILFVRYDGRKKTVTKLDETTIFAKGKEEISITTWPDGSFTMTSAPSGYKDSEHWREDASCFPGTKGGRKREKWSLEYFNRDHDRSQPETVSQYTEADSGKIVNEHVKHERIEREKMLAGGDGKGRHWKTHIKYDKKVGDTEVIKDCTTREWTKHLPEFKTIETFIDMINGKEYILSSQLESKNEVRDRLDPSKDLSVYTSSGTYVTEAKPEESHKVLRKNGDTKHVHQGVAIEKTKTRNYQEIGIYTADGRKNKAGNVVPKNNHEFEAQYRYDTVRLIVTGLDGRPILIDAPASDVPRWLGGTSACEDRLNSIVTVLYYSQTKGKFTPLSDKVDQRDDTLDRELCHIVKNPVNPNPEQTKHKEESGLGREFVQIAYVYDSYKQVWLKPSDDIFKNPDVTFTVAESKDLQIIGELQRKYSSAGNDFLARADLEQGQVLPEEFCKLSELTPLNSEKINSALTGKSSLEATLEETIIQKTDGSTERSANSHVFGLTNIQASPETTSKSEIQGVKLDWRSVETNAQQVNFLQQVDSKGEASFDQGATAPMKFIQTIATGPDGRPIISNETPENVPDAFGGSVLKNIATDQNLANPSVSVLDYQKYESKRADDPASADRNLNVYLEDIYDPNPTPVVLADDGLGRETTTFSYDITLSENIQLAIDKDLGQEGAAFTIESRTDTGVCGRDVKIFNQAGKPFLESELIKEGEKFSDAFGQLTDLASESVDKIRADLEGGQGDVEAQTGLIHRTNKFKDGHNETDAFASVQGRQGVSRAETVTSQPTIAGRSLQSTTNESTGQGFEYSQHTGHDGKTSMSEKKDLGEIKHKQEVITGSGGAPILSKTAPSKVPDQLGGKAINAAISETEFKGEAQATVQSYQKTEKIHSETPENDKTNRHLYVLVDDVKGTVKLHGVNFFKGRYSTSSTTDYHSSTLMQFSAAKDLGDGNTEFELQQTSENDVKRMKEVQYKGLFGGHLDSQSLTPGQALKANFGSNAELSSANRDVIASQISGKETTRLDANLSRVTLTHKDGSVDRTAVTIVNVLTGAQETTTVNDSWLMGLLTKSTHEVSGQATEYKQQITESSKASQSESSLLQDILQFIGIYTKASREPGVIQETFTQREIGLLQELTTLDQGLFIDEFTKQNLINGEIPIDPATGLPTEPAKTEQLAPFGSAITGSVFGTCMEAYQRTQKTCPEDQKLDGRAKVVEFVKKKSASTVLKGVQAVLSGGGKTSSLAALVTLTVKMGLHCLSKSCLDDLGAAKTLTSYDLLECLGVSATEMALRLKGYPGMAIASYAVTPAVKLTKFCCKTYRGDNDCRVGKEYCTNDKRTCPAGDLCPWDCSLDLCAESAVSSVAGGGITMSTITCVSYAASFCMGPVLGSICSIAVSAVVAPLATPCVVKKVRETGYILKTENTLLKERGTAVLSWELEVLRKAYSTKGFTLKMEDLLASKDPHMIWQRGKLVMLKMHPDKRVQDRRDHIEQVVKTSPEYLALPTEKAKKDLADKIEADLWKKHTLEQQDFNQKLVELMAVAEAVFDLNVPSKTGSKSPGTIGTDKKAKEAEEESIFLSSYQYLRASFVMAKKKCSDTISSVLLYRLYSREYYANRLKKNYGLVANFTMNDILEAYNNAHLNFSAKVCSDFIEFFESLNHYDSFGLETIELAVLKKISHNQEYEVAIRLDLAAIAQDYYDGRLEDIRAKLMNPIPGQRLTHPLSLSLVQSTDSKILNWLVLDLFVLCPLPEAFYTDEMLQIKNYLTIKDAKNLKEKAGCPIEMLDKILKQGIHIETPSSLSKVVPWLNNCSKMTGELPLSINDGEFELFGYVQEKIDNCSDTRQWAQTPSLTIRSGNGFIRLDGTSAYVAGVLNDSSTVRAGPVMYALYLPSSTDPRPLLIPEDQETFMLKPLLIPDSVLEAFSKLSKANTDRDIETCGILAGSLIEGHYFVTHLIVPKQTGSSDHCDMEHEEEIVEVQEKHDVIQLGWIHTHPSHECFMSAVDLHTHHGFQKSIPEAVAIVLAPTQTPNYGVFRLTNPTGIQTIQNCSQRGFHEHHFTQPIYSRLDEQQSHAKFVEGLGLDLIDLRS